jgi:hypothetical protein
MACDLQHPEHRLLLIVRLDTGKDGESKIQIVLVNLIVYRSDVSKLALNARSEIDVGRSKGVHQKVPNPYLRSDGRAKETGRSSISLGVGLESRPSFAVFASLVSG